MNSFGPLLILIWGKTNRVRPGGRSLVKVLPRVEGIVTRHFWKIIRGGVDVDFDEVDPLLRLRAALSVDSLKCRGLAERSSIACGTQAKEQICGICRP